MTSAEDKEELKKFRNMRGIQPEEVKLNIDEDQILLTDELDPIRIAKWIADCGVQEDPFYLVDIPDIVRKYEEWREKIPRVKPFYAVKCNDHPFVLSVLAALGTGFDCASKVEIDKILELGVDPSRIIFANPTKLASHIRYAKETNVTLMTFDNGIELEKIKDLYPTAKLLLRIRSDARVAQFPLGNKFGCNLKTEAPTLLRKARNLNLEVVGICFHVGSGCKEPEAYRRGIAAVGELFVLGRELGFQMRLLDIGGGFRGVKECSPDEFAGIINTALEEHFPEGCGVDVMSEPGTYFVASALSIAAPVHSKRTLDNPTESCPKYNMYWIHEGVYTSFDIALYDSEFVKPIVLKTSNTSHPSQFIPATIWGSVISEVDCIKVNVRLPDLNVGDWLIFENMGAYSNVLGRRMHGNPVPKFGAIVTPSVRPFMENLVQSGQFPVHTLPSFERHRDNDSDSLFVRHSGSQNSEFKLPLYTKLMMMCKRIGLWYANVQSTQTCVSSGCDWPNLVHLGSGSRLL